MAYQISNISILPGRDMESIDLHDTSSHLSRHLSPQLSSHDTSTPQTVSSLSRTHGADAQTLLNEPDHEVLPEAETLSSVHTANRRRYQVFAPWKWEIMSLGLCIGTNVAMFVILTKYNRKHVLNWGYNINLSTILSMLSTVQRAALLTILTSIISQAKWLWIGNQARPLQHLHVMDSASRGVWGVISAIPLAMRTNPRLLATVLIILVSFGIGPFTQQAIGTEPCPETVSGQAMVPYTLYVYWPFTTQPYYNQPPSEIEKNIYSSLMEPNGPESNLRFQCTTGNCTFDTRDEPVNTTDIDGVGAFSTMALCHRCVDVTHLISSGSTPGTNGTVITNYSLHGLVGYNQVESALLFKGDGASNVVFQSITSNLSWAGKAIPQDVQDISTSALANITILACNSKRCNGQRNDIYASTCVLYPCIRSYNVSITNGELDQKQVSTSPTITSGLVQAEIYSNGPSGNYTILWFGDPDRVPIDWIAAKSPCRIGDNVYTLQNIYFGSNHNTTWSCSRATNGTHGDCDSVTDPQYCLYRQSSQHGQAVSSILFKYLTQECVYMVNDDLECNDLPSAVQGSVANVLFQRGNVTTETIDEYFDALAASISNQYRNHYGRTPPTWWVASADDPPFGEVHGVVQQTKTCNKIYLEWLAFPTAITALTAGILLWTIAESWGKRRNRPVWKDHVLPLLLYSNRFTRGVEGSTITEESHAGDRSPSDDNEKLLETDEMEKLAVSLQVRFQWPGDEDTKAEAVLRRKKGLRDVDVDSLLQE
ncbi:hypothetical protein PG985_003812 [Apiospora marii]|uniref:uncharacterized protein n=1 Tax=Apiospora marii TaxID=335849 RepID=UPI00312ED919